MALTQQNKSHYTPEAGSAMAQYLVVTGYSQKVATSAMIIFDCHWRFADEVIKEFKLLNFYSC
jgi:hypothetical protein